MYTVCQDVRSTHGRDGAVVLDIGRGRIFNVNLVGSRILELLESGTEQSEIVNTISREFNVDGEEVKQDVDEFIASLEKHKLIERR